jgi:phosphoribosyl 1,2-cyclic phosphate phosphodiesterase
MIEGDARVVIDVSVDFRQQMLKHHFKDLDAVILTHHHSDHVLGLDDLMPFNGWDAPCLCMRIGERWMK